MRCTRVKPLTRRANHGQKATVAQFADAAACPSGKQELRPARWSRSWDHVSWIKAMGLVHCHR